MEFGVDDGEAVDLAGTGCIGVAAGKVAVAVEGIEVASTGVEGIGLAGRPEGLEMTKVKVELEFEIGFEWVG